MVITDYRVQSVLRTYTRQLQRSKLASIADPSPGEDTNAARVSISEEGKRRLMMDRLAGQVREKMYPKQEEDAGTDGKDSKVKTAPGTEGNQ